MGGRDALTFFLCGDVMTGRGVDQILAHPLPPRLYECVATSALDYVALAERAGGAVPRGVDPTYAWGVVPELLDRERPDVRIINLETSITTSEDAAPKGINYRMHPANLGVLTAIRIDCCVLANNHVLDWGIPGLLETLDTLASAAIPTAGAGLDLAAAEAPAVLELGDVTRVLVFAFCYEDAGIPPSWGAGGDTPGVHWLPDFSRRTADRIAHLVEGARRPGDIVVASVHWGSNWGYEIPAAHRRFAHALIDGARVDVVHGHSSHHPRAIEVYAGRPIFYGCGDFLNDYEGIRGYERLRGDLALMYFPTLDERTGELIRLEMAPLRIRGFRLQHPPSPDRDWLRETLDRECARFGHRVTARDDLLELAWR